MTDDELPPFPRDDHYDANIGRLETPEFCAWFDTRCPQADVELSYPGELEDYWTRRSYSLQGWVAGYAVAEAPAAPAKPKKKAAKKRKKKAAKRG